jgi:hypothetical protein
MKLSINKLIIASALIILSALIYGSIVIIRISHKGKLEGKWQQSVNASGKESVIYYVFSGGNFNTNKDDDGEGVINLGGLKKIYSLDADNIAILKSGAGTDCENGSVGCSIKRYKIEFNNFGKVLLMTDLECKNNCKEEYKKM